MEWAADVNARLESVVCRAVRIAGEGDPAAQWVAARQHGVISGPQARGCGLGRAAISGRLRRRIWSPVQRGVYLIGAQPPSDHARVLAAVLRCRPNALASHETALWLWGLSERLGKEIEVTVVDARNPGSLNGVRVQRRRVALLGPGRWRFGIPVTDVVGTLVDAAGVVSAAELEARCALAVRQRLTTWPKLRAAVQRSPGRAGIEALRELAKAGASAHVSRSGNERAMLRLVHDAGLPRPESNIVICGKELDLYWSDAKLAVEVDAFGTHGGNRSFEDDRRVDADLKAAGIEVLRFTGHRIRSAPLSVVARLAAVLTLRLGGLPAPRRR